MLTRSDLVVGLAMTLHPLGALADVGPRSEVPSLRPPAPPASLGRAPHGEIEVWVDLSLPALGSLPGDKHDERTALRQRIAQQQDEVMAQLARLGAVEVARVQQVRNSVAVRMPANALVHARKIPGVRNVRTVQHIERKAP